MTTTTQGSHSAAADTMDADISAEIITAQCVDDPHFPAGTMLNFIQPEAPKGWEKIENKPAGK